jgi:predicted nucleotide-binding protein
VSFISRICLPIAGAIQELLDPVAECTIWNQGVFTPSGTTIDSLQDARLLYDFAIVVVTSDDTTTKRGVVAPAPRDNLLFELGLFAGALGRARTFLVLPADAPPRLPSDLSGVTTTSFRSRSDGNLVAALRPAMSQIMRAMGIDRGAG